MKKKNKTQFHCRNYSKRLINIEVNRISYCPACNWINLIDIRCVNSVNYSISSKLENKQHAEHSFTLSQSVSFTLWNPILPPLLCVYLLLNLIFHLLWYVYNCRLEERKKHKNWLGVENFDSVFHILFSFFFDSFSSFDFEYF